MAWLQTDIICVAFMSEKIFLRLLAEHKCMQKDMSVKFKENEVIKIKRNNSFLFKKIMRIYQFERKNTDQRLNESLLINKKCQSITQHFIVFNVSLTVQLSIFI